MNEWRVVGGKRHAVFGMRIEHVNGWVVYSATLERRGGKRLVKLTLSVDGHPRVYRYATVGTDLRSLTCEADSLVRDFKRLCLS